MTHTMQAPDEPDVESTRRREVTYWVDERNGLFPLPWWKLLPLIALIGAAVIAVMTLIMIPIYERQVIDNAKAELTAAGIDPAAFTFDASYRDLDISGTLPDGVSVDDIRAAAEQGDGQRDLDLDFDPTPAPVVEEADDAPADTPVTPETAPTDVTAVVTDTGIVLGGEVPSEAHRALLVAAASKDGTVNVTDELVVRDLEPSKAGASGRVLALATLLRGLPEGATGSASITDDAYTSGWTVSSEADADAIRATLAGASGAFSTPTGSNASTDVTVDAPPVSEEIETLQSEFGDLEAEIRENVTFATGSDVLNDTATETLDKVVDLMNLYSLPVVKISGHTDDVGNDDSNLELSDLRAAAVRQYLVDAGIDADRIQSEGLGETKPLVPNDSNEARAENRRVELTALVEFDS